MSNISIKPIVALLFAILFATVFTLGGPLLAAFLLLALGLVSVCIYNPRIYLVLFLITLIDFFGYLNPEEQFYLPGIAKFEDVILIIGVLLWGIEIFIKKNKSLVDKNSPVIKFMFFLFLMLVINWIRTYLIYSLDFQSIFQYSRRYLFYLAYFFPIYFLKNKQHLRFFLMGVLVAICIYSLLIIFQFSLGSSINLMGNTVIAMQSLSGKIVPRIYYRGILLLLVVFSCSLGYYAYSKNKSKVLACITGVVGLAIFLHFSRMFWIALIAIILYWFRKMLRLNKIIVLILTLAMIIGLIGTLTSTVMFANTFDHLISSMSDIIYQEGTFRYRVEESWFRFQLIGKHLFFGPGFIHPKHLPDIIPIVNNERPDLANVDVGLVAIFTDFGICGFFLFCFLIISLVISERKIAEIKDHLNKFNGFIGVAHGCFLFVVLGSIITLTHGFFTSSSNIAIVALALGLRDKIYSFKNKEFCHDDWN